MELPFPLAVVLLTGSWLVLRRQAGGGTCWLALPLDIGPIVLGWLLALSIGRRPILAAIVIVACAAGLTLTDIVKRATLREPVVFADRAELLEVVRHPRFYLPFAGTWNVIGGAAASVAGVLVLIWLEPATWFPSPVLMIVLTMACFLLPGQPPFVSVIARGYRRLGVTGDPATDMRRLGFLACLIVHVTLAQDERAQRQSRAPDFPQLPPLPETGPVVLVQLESFFDARRLSTLVPANLLPGLDRLQREAIHAGRLDVPCWGANTIRSEFMALTGIGADALGLDRFNPYERFALQRVRSLAWTMKQAGFRTICLHPFDKTFYGRDRAMPMLGFDEFRGPEVFANAPTVGGYVTDMAVGQEILRILATEGPRVFIFAITIANHGPWDRAGVHTPLTGISDEILNLLNGVELGRYLAGLVAEDAMLHALAGELPPNTLLAVYGDHQPSLPKAFAALGFEDERTDYVLWRAGAGHNPTAWQDRRCEDLPELLLRTLAAAAQTHSSMAPQKASI